MYHTFDTICLSCLGSFFLFAGTVCTRLMWLEWSQGRRDMKRLKETLSKSPNQYNK